MTPAPKRGEIWVARLDPAVGSEQRGTRPVLVVSNDMFNEAMPIVSVAPVTTRRQERTIYPSEVPLAAGTAHLRVESIVLCHQVRTISRDRLGNRLGPVPGDVLAGVDRALALHLSLRVL